MTTQGLDNIDYTVLDDLLREAQTGFDKDTANFEKWDEYFATLRDFATSHSYLVVGDHRDSWKEITEQWTEESYSAMTLDGALRVMTALSEGGDPQEAYEAAQTVDLTRCQAERLADLVAEYHPCGAEYKEHSDFKLSF